MWGQSVPLAMLLVLFLVRSCVAQILSNVLLTFPSGCNRYHIEIWPSSLRVFSTDYFDASHLACIPCRNGSVPSSDSFSCVCSNRQRLVQVTPGGPICQDCPQGYSTTPKVAYPFVCLGTVTAPDGLSCIGCSGQANCSTSCPSDSVAVYRKTDGSLPEG